MMSRPSILDRALGKSATTGHSKAVESNNSRDRLRAANSN